jgi:colanic acid biosynthesis protein WcaH
MIEQSLYNQIVENIPICCVDVCILREKGVLLVKRNTEPACDTLWLPGGRLYKNELLKDCAYRKAKEETGIECIVGPIVHTDETVFDTGPSGIPIHSINVCFLLMPITLTIKLDQYSDDYKWVKTIPLDIHPYVGKCLEKCGLNYYK